MSNGVTSVLVVDDEPAICMLIQDALSEHGVLCEVAIDGRAAERLLATGRFSVMVADIQMPHATGLDLLAYARQHVPTCRVVLITGSSLREHLAQAIMLGAYDYVRKPFDPFELAKLVIEASGSNDSSPLPYRAAEAMELSSRAQQASLDSVQALVRAVEAKDPYTRRHSEQVAHYAIHLAEAMGITGDALQQLHTASLLHDVGKIGVPDSVLTCPGRLTAEQFAQIRLHPGLGAEILANITLFQKEAQLVRHHHEHWDGRGYPDGLTGEETPFASRLIGVADSIDAMLMERTYKKGFPVEMMLGELARCAGTQFDPAIAAAAIDWCTSHPDLLILPAGRTVMTA